MKLLLHCCCAPCSIQCVEVLAGEGIKPDLFWYNPNIHPFTEYQSRLASLRSFAEEKNLALKTNDIYGLRLFLDKTSLGAEGRCTVCYKMRLEETALAAKEMLYDGFSTTLLISPYQKHEEITGLGNELALKYGLAFVYRDFRPRFREGQKQARASSYYMQKYCGCIFSEEERYLSGAGQ